MNLFQSSVIPQQSTVTIVNLDNTRLCFDSVDKNGNSTSSGCLDAALSKYSSIPFDQNGYLAVSGPLADNHVKLDSKADTILIGCNSIAVLDKNQNVVQYNSSYYTLNSMC